MLDFNIAKYSLPAWEQISGHPKYSELNEDDKKLLKTYLSLQKEYWNYSPITGRLWGVTRDATFPDFPEPEIEVKAK